MSQISQNPDGTYTRTYSDTELTLIKSLQEEIKMRVGGDQELWAGLTTVTNRIESLEEGRFSLSELQNIITGNIARLDTHETRLMHLEESVIIDAYSKVQTDQIIPWKVEQIAHTFDIPTNQMFDRANLDDIKIGYKNYHHGDIYEPYDNHVPENTMQRFTIWAFASRPRIATFNINYADRCVVMIDDVVHETYIDVGGNFGKVAKVTKVDLKEGWTRIQFLIANETQAGGLVVTSDLIEQADYLTNLDYFSGMITGDRIQAGTLDERHFSPNMDLVVHTIHATATDVPGVIIGNPNEQGILQIADGTISKAKDEPFVFSDGIRVNGYIRVTQLLIDKDFIRAGDGIIVNTIKDEYGYTKMYEIINDVRIVNGGGMVITGDAQQGYTITNDLQIKVKPGLIIDGDPIRGYVLANDMKLTSLGGIEVLGNAIEGYTVRNIMKLTSDYGIIRVEGNAWEGYSLRNVLEILAGGGIRLQGSVNEGKITIINDMKLYAKTPDGSVRVTGSADTAYYIEGLWPTITGLEGIEVGNPNPGSYTIKNTGVLALYAGEGIAVDRSTGYVTVRNTGVLGIYAGQGISVDRSTGHVTVRNTGVINLTGSGKAQVNNFGGGTYNVHVPPITEEEVQALQAPWEFGHASATPNIGPSGWFNESNPQFIQTSSGGQILAGFFSGVIPPTADCFRFSTQGGISEGSGTMRMILEFKVRDPDNGGEWMEIVERYLSVSLPAVNNLNNYNEFIHQLSIPVRSYWRHYDVRCMISFMGGSGKANGKFRELWTDVASKRSAHDLG